MKYIKTPYEIYDLENSMVYCFDGARYPNKCCTYYENNPDDCKVADKIEDLCDGFYIDIEFNVEHLSNCEYAFHHFEMFVKTMKSFRTNNKVMVKKLNGGYGYVKTNKGLVYVAKLNSKGELELI